MSDLWKIGLPAVLALIGTIAGLWFGHWRWWSEFRRTKRRAFDARRFDAYQELWTLLESAHITLRTGRPEKCEVSELEQSINAFRLKNAIFLDASDSTLSGQYFTGLVKLAAAIAESGSRELAERYHATSRFENADIAGMRELVEANEQANRLRDELIGRVRAVMLETSYAAAPARASS